MEHFSPNRNLPSNLRFKPTESHLYRIGLNLNRELNYEMRSLLKRPLIVFSIILTQIIKNHIFVEFMDKNRSLSTKWGNISYFLGMNFHFNIGCNLFYYLAIYSHLVYYFNRRNDVSPTFLRVFQMMSGRIPPKDVGLKNEEQIRSLIRRTRISFKIFDQMIKISVFGFGHILVYTVYVLFCTPMETLLYGVPNNLLFVSTVYYSSETNLFQVLYFYLICHYLKLRIKAIHKTIEEMIKNKNVLNFGSVLKSLNEVTVEIDEYNQTFWSKFMFGFWMTVGAQIVLFLFGAIFLEMSVLHRIIMVYILVILGPLFLFVIFTASSVNFEANKSHKLLIRLFIAISDCKGKISRNRRLRDKYKVSKYQISI